MMALSPSKPRRAALVALALAALSSGSCVERGELSQDTFRLRVELTREDGSPLPGPADAPLCLDLRGLNPACPEGQKFLLTVEAIAPSGARDTAFNGYARVSVLPGTVLSVLGDRSEGRNVRLENGLVTGQKVHVIGAFGPSRIIVEDLGYNPGDPTDPSKLPKCADGIDNDDDGLIDFPADPGCAFSNDDSETPGSFAAGASLSLNYALPTVPEVQGFGAGTPFAQEGVQLDTTPPRSDLVVTRVASNGFYVSTVTESTDAQGQPITLPIDYGSLFVFNFGLPEGVLVCDRVTYLSGTMDEFFGYTGMNFPSFEVEPFLADPAAKTPNKRCRVPQPVQLGPQDVSNNATLEKIEAGLVRIRSAHIAGSFGPNFPQEAPFDLSSSFPCQGTKKYTFGPGASNCDFDRSGRLSFENGSDEGLCSCFCYQDPECSEWTSFSGRGNYRVVLGSDATNTLQANTRTIPTFNPQASAGKGIRSLTGIVSNFSGGNLNWTIEARCPDDLVLCEGGQADCADDPPAGLSADKACIGKRIALDNDSESN